MAEAKSTKKTGSSAKGDTTKESTSKTSKAQAPAKKAPKMVKVVVQNKLKQKLSLFVSPKFTLSLAPQERKELEVQEDQLNMLLKHRKEVIVTTKK